MVTSSQRNRAIQVPASWEGSVPEYMVLQALNRLGLRDGLEFTYQSPLLGGRMEKGGSIVDFLFNDPPNLVINVQGEYWHYAQGVTKTMTDDMARATLAGQGITLIMIDENDIYKDVDFYVREALQFRDHSKQVGR